MAVQNLIPTSNQTPDAGQPGTAGVSSPSNTGHASTSASAVFVLVPATDSRSCRWSGFPAEPGGQIISKTLKITHTSSGGLSGGTPGNAFTLEYSLNGGGSWLTAVSRTNFTASQGPTVFSVALGVGQDLTQVQVRDFISASASLEGDSADATVTISDISIEVTTADLSQLPVMM